MVGMRKNWKRRLKWLGWLIAALFFITTFQRLLQQNNWQTIYRSAQWPNFLIACCFLLVGLFFRSMSGKVAHDTLRYPITVIQSYRFWFVSQLSKYIPGGVWQFATRGSMYTLNGMPALLSAAVIIWETLIILLTGIFLVLSSDVAMSDDNHRRLLGLAIALLLLTWLTQARWFWQLLIQVRLPLATQMLTIINQLGARRYWATIGLTGLALIGWVFINLGFYFVALTFITAEQIRLTQAFFIYSLAWVTGFLVIIAPGGLGIRELVILAFFTPLAGESVAILISVLSRLWWMLAEGIHISFTFGLSLLENRKGSVS